MPKESFSLEGNLKRGSKNSIQICCYFIWDKTSCDQFGIDISKGILLTGSVGCGKTSLMRHLKHMVPHYRPYEVIPTQNIVFGFNNIEYRIIEQYGDHQFLLL